MVKCAIALAFSALFVGCALESRPTNGANGGLEGQGGIAGDGGEGGLGGASGMGGAGGVGGVDIGLPTCTPATERTDCPETSCDPATMRCSTFKLASRPACWTCVSDNDCESPDHRCVEMFFQGERFPDDKHGFCLQVALVEVELDDGVYELDDTDESNCAAPLRTVLVKRPSLSGPPTSSYCGLREDLTTCFAVRAYESLEECPNGADEECPDGAVCRAFDHTGRTINCCTLLCDADHQCPSVDGQPTYCAGYCGGSSGGGDGD